VIVNNRLEFSLALALVLAGSLAAPALLRPLEINPVSSQVQSATIRSNLSERDVTDAPYSAIEENMYSKKKDDGTYADTTLTSTHIYRDSQGRTRAERYVTSYRDDKPEARLMSIVITDPVTDSLYRLDKENLVATRRSWKAFQTEPLDPCSISSPQPKFPVTTDSLGPKTFEGLTVEGYRQSMQAPAGAVGNGNIIDVVEETWISSDLKVAVLTKRDDSPGRRSTIRLTHVDRSEPDAALFQIPPDYKIEILDGSRRLGCGHASPPSADEETDKRR